MVIAVGLDWRLRDLDLLKVTQGEIRQTIELLYKICYESTNLVDNCVLCSDILTLTFNEGHPCGKLSRGCDKRSIMGTI